MADKFDKFQGVNPLNPLNIPLKAGISYGGGKPGWGPSPGWALPFDVWGILNAPSGAEPSGPPAYSQFTFDTIGQTIFRSVGHCRLPLRIIWVEGITNIGDALPEGATSYTFAAALCAPFDPLEEGDFAALYDGNDVIYTTDDGVLLPENWSPEDQTLLVEAINNATFYPGTEDQDPDPLILADKGVEIANAFRGLRYIVVPGYPLRQPNLSSVFIRTSTTTNITAVEFGLGSS